MKTYQLTLDDATRFALKNSRRNDEMTAVRAAQKAYANAQTHRTIALRVHAQHTACFTDFELAELCGIPQTSIGKRRGELVILEMIERTEITRPSPTGSAARVWRITKKGLEMSK